MPSSYHLPSTFLTIGWTWHFSLFSGVDVGCDLAHAAVAECTYGTLSPALDPRPVGTVSLQWKRREGNDGVSPWGGSISQRREPPKQKQFDFILQLVTY